MSSQNENKPNAAKEMGSKMRDREQTRREEERGEWEDLNQSTQIGTHDATHSGINWGPSYKNRRRKPSHS